MRHMLRKGRILLVSLVLLAAGAGWASTAGAASGTSLVGTFQIAPGTCNGGMASGSYIRMVLPGGSPSAGPYFSNNYSSCSNQTYTLLKPGTDGGLITGSYQAAPSPPFDKNGNARADRITAPQDFEGTSFATATSAVDPQTNVKVNAPNIVASGNALSGDLRSFGVFWNNQVFNQGSPKPAGTYPGDTSRVTGTFDSATGAYTLNWSSQVEGGPFNDFTGVWHLTGRFVPAQAPTSGTTPSSTAPASGTTPTGSTASVPISNGGPSAGSSGSATPTPGASTPAASSAAGSSGSASGAQSSSTPGTSPSSSPQASGAVGQQALAGSKGKGSGAPTWLIVLAAVLVVLVASGIYFTRVRGQRAG